ncbi:hypothetical protein Ancab_022003 [Ancistrocladus abbreviatus]
MALWMEEGSEPKTDTEKADLDAISALKVSAAIELKEKGNEFVKMGKKHYSDAIDCYTRAINQKVFSESETSILFANRAHVNLLLGNNRRALEDAEQAIKLSPTNIKAFYRAAKASLSLEMLREAKSHCEKGLELSPDNEEVKKLTRQTDIRLSEHKRHEAEVASALRAAKNLVAAFEDRKLKFGKAMYQELTGLKKPVLDNNNILHWPVLLLYAEVMSSDIIEDFCETDMFSSHLDVGSAVCLSKAEVLHYLLEGTAGSGVVNLDEEKGSSELSKSAGRGHSKWVKVNEKRTLNDVLKGSDFVIPGIPVFYVVSKSSSFYKDFKAGKWARPPFRDEDSG